MPLISICYHVYLIAPQCQPVIFEHISFGQLLDPNVSMSKVYGLLVLWCIRGWLFWMLFDKSLDQIKLKHFFSQKFVKNLIVLIF